MFRVCFGNHPDFGRAAADQLDPERFVADYGFSASTDLTPYDCVVPFRFGDYELLRAADAPGGAKWWIPTTEVVGLCHDKLAFIQWLSRRGFAHLAPPLIAGGRGIFPYIVKKRLDENGVNSHVVTNLEEERAILPLCNSNEYFCQAYVPGEYEYAMHGLVAKGEVCYARVVRFFMGKEYYAKGIGGHAVDFTSVPADDHLAVFAPMIRSLGYEGTFCIDYKTLDGQPQLLELNPRLGYSLLKDVNRYLDAYLHTIEYGVAAGQA